MLKPEVIISRATIKIAKNINSINKKIAKNINTTNKELEKGLKDTNLINKKLINKLFQKYKKK